MRDFFYLLLQEYIQIDNQVIYVISHRYYYVHCYAPSFWIGLFFQSHSARLYAAKVGMDRNSQGSVQPPL